MKSFLKAVAKDIINKYGTDLSKVTVVFPNKRASLFLNRFLYEETGHSLWSPSYLTISELFRRNSKLQVVDHIEAVMTLYECYQQVVSNAESIDRFWSWGEMILADFDDLDKNLGDAGKIFCNVKDLHALDSIDYLSEEQRSTLQHFFLQFNNSHDSYLKERFLHLWNNLYSLYSLYNKTLHARGLAYEGALYREVAEHWDSGTPELRTACAMTSGNDSGTFLFVGFNMVQKSEQMLFRTLQKTGQAHFYWDFDHYYIDNPVQEAGRFIREYLSRFPNELPLDSPVYNQFSSGKDLHILSAPTEEIQVRYISQWLHENGRMEAGTRTAIVLSDESLMTRIIHNLPEELDGKANITLGFPLSQSPVTALVKSFMLLHLHGYTPGSKNYLLKFVAPILRHQLIAQATPEASSILGYLQEQHITYPLISDLCKDELTALLFQPLQGKDINALMTQRLLSILEHIGQIWSSIETSAKQPLLNEALFRMYTLLNRMNDVLNKKEEVACSILPVTYCRLFDQIIQGTTMPFHGEPAVGVQIMGVLETRNLDFDHVLILSCNEGNLPKGINDSSLIPYSIRTAHQLTTIDNKVAVYAYYFYRLLQRCPDISVSWNCSTEGMHTGQMSRFLLQLMVEAPNIHIDKHSLTAEGNPPMAGSLQPMAKTEDVIKKLLALEKLSPSAINKYLRCQKQFYYNMVEELREENPDDISDKRIFGTVFHKAAELLYRTLAAKDGFITKEAITALLAEKSHATIYRKVDEAFTEELFAGRKRPYDGLQLINREVIVKYLTILLRKDKEEAPFYHLADELYVSEEMQFPLVDGNVKVLQIGGYIDRLDLRPRKDGDTLMVIDYKTGSKLPGEMSSMEDVFSPDKISKHSDYYLQTFLYSIILAKKKKEPVAPALLYIQKSESIANPVLRLGGAEVTNIRPYENEFREKLSKLIQEIYNKNIPFSPTKDQKSCANCPYKQLCYN